MTVRTTNITLWALAAAMAVAAVAIFVGAFVLPIETASTQVLDRPSTQPAEVAPSNSLDRNEVAWSRPLRDLSSMRAASAPATMPGGELHLALVGTVGHSLALLQTPDGTIEVRGIGESLGGAEVLSVEPLKVELRYNGHVVTLVKPRPSDDG